MLKEKIKPHCNDCGAIGDCGYSYDSEKCRAYRNGLAAGIGRAKFNGQCVHGIPIGQLCPQCVGIEKLYYTKSYTEPINRIILKINEMIGAINGKL